MLEELRRMLESTHQFSVVRRGRGQSRFLYVTYDRRAVEASVADDCKLWVEFWDTADEQSDDAPVGEAYFACATAAFRAIMEWM